MLDILLDGLIGAKIELTLLREEGFPINWRHGDEFGLYHLVPVTGIPETGTK